MVSGDWQKSELNGGSNGLTRREMMAMTALGLAAGAAAPAAAARPGGTVDVGGARLAGARPGSTRPRRQGIITPFMVLYALHDAMVKPMPGKPQAPCLAEVLVGFRGRPQLRIRAARRRQVPQRRAGDGRGRQVLVRALRGAAHDLMKKQRGGDRNSRSAACPFQAENAVARFSDVLFERQRRRLDRAEEICREGRRRRLQAGADRRRPLQVRLVHAGRRTGARSVRRLLAQDARGQAPGHEGDPGRGDAARRIEARRGRHRLFDPRRTGRGAAQTPGLEPEAGGVAGAELALFPRAMGPEIAVARSARAPGRQSGDRPRRDEPGAVSRLLQDHRQHRPLYASNFTGSRRRRSTIPTKAKKLLAEAGYPNGFDAGLMYCDSSYSNMAEVSIDNLQQVGIRAKLQPIERAGFFAGYTEQEIHDAASSGASGAFGNAATRLASFVVKGGAYAYGSYPDIDALYPQQADRARPDETRGDPRQDAAARLRQGDLRADLAAGLSQRRWAARRRIGVSG